MTTGRAESREASCCGATDADEQIVKVLRQAKVPVILVANKVDDERAELEATRLWSLGLGEPYTVSALHGRGSGDLLDVVLSALPEEGSGQELWVSDGTSTGTSFFKLGGMWGNLDKSNCI